MIRAILRNAGISMSRLISAVRGWYHYLSDRADYKKAMQSNGWTWGPELPMLMERDEDSGTLGAYFLQDQLVARWIYEASPTRHVDVGSRLDGFIGSISVFREVEVIDIRPQPASVNNVKFHQLDLMSKLPNDWIECSDSLSCLHTIEHFGLGRYGDPIDPDGHIKGLAQLKQMVSPGGMLYLSTPIGPQRVEFNAHRVTAASTLIEWFNEGWCIERFSVIDDSNQVSEFADWKRSDVANHFGCHLGVGIVAARKI